MRDERVFGRSIRTL
jgi:hypothetical protein